MNYFLHLVFLVSLFSSLAVALEFIVGRLGNVSLAHATFFGIGAYASGLVTVGSGAGFLAGLFVGICVALLCSIAFGLASIRTKSDYFVLTTLAIQVLFTSAIVNLKNITNGPRGITGIPRPSILGWQVDTVGEFAAVASILAFCVLALFSAINRSPLGRVLVAIREDERFVLSTGRSPTPYKLTTFALSAAATSVTGSLYAHYYTFIEPDSFELMTSILILSMVVIGGVGSTAGPIIGALAIIGIPEVLRYIGLASSDAALVRQIAFGALLVLILMYRPQGLLGDHEIR